jgi:hypothetical protein
MSLTVIPLFAGNGIEISGEGGGFVKIEQMRGCVTFADRDAVRVAKAILAAAGYGPVELSRWIGCGFVELGDDDLPDISLHQRGLPRGHQPPKTENAGDLFGGMS